MRIWAVVIFLNMLLVSPIGALAKMESGGVKMELSIGQPGVTIENPDGTKAGYSGLSAMGRGFLPVMGSGFFRADFTGTIKYLDLSNTANGDQKEFAQYLGPGLGLQISISRFYIGADYMFLKGRHSAVGPFANQNEFNITGVDIHAGVRMEFGTGAIGFAWSQMSSTVPSSATGLSKNSPWADQVYWLQFSYNFKSTPGKLIKDLFGK